AHRFGRWPNVGFKNPIYAVLPNCFYFVRLFFRMGMKRWVYQPKLPVIVHSFVSLFLAFHCMASPLGGSPSRRGAYLIFRVWYNIRFLHA
ncbi:hypothetical protein, partial [Uruburuella suis]|uniref:hypothetical protein n=1 Tax=Uruburuella suis TaxID=252130 RepID=UPI003F4A9CFF